MQFTRRDNLVEASRKDLVGANSEQTASLVAALLKKAKGGVLLLSDAASYAEKTDHYGNLALSLVVNELVELYTHVPFLFCLSFS